ncbi:DUF3617 family protein [Novosphingobium sp. B 225]|uniref:DUF3617 family protein n=1 Tax=Novosphingobium sp. B 225 TaxID=1961849 RepID=UPI000B4BDD45|nr:DUF3617 family protein [Novosphingobium sp. B 225]
MRRPVLAAAVVALTLGGAAQAGGGPAAATATPIPTNLARYDEAQLRAVLADMGWKAEFSGNGKAPYLGVWSKLGLPYQISGIQCADAAAQNCEAIRLRYRNALQHADAAGIARRLNAKQYFLRATFSAAPGGGTASFEPERVIVLKGGVSPAQIKANLAEFESWIVQLIPGIGLAFPASYSGLTPGLYSMTMSTGSGSFSQNICLTPSDVRDPILKVAADMTNGGSGCSVSNGTGSATMQCTGRIVEGNISASGMSTSLRFSGNALIDTDNMGGRARIQFQGSASRTGDC